MEGQLSIFDIDWNALEAPRTLLEVGMKVYTVSRGEVTERAVEGTYNVRNEKEQYYWLSGSNMKDSDLGERVFLNRKDAEAKAHDYLENHSVLLSSSIGCTETHCYTYTRSVDNKKMYAYYGFGYPIAGEKNCILFEKGSMTFQHMIIFPTKQKALEYIKKEFLKKEVEIYGAVECDLSPVKWKNMYPCKEKDHWDFSEEGYSGIEDKPKREYIG